MEESSLQDRGIHRQKMARLSWRHPHHVQDQSVLHQSTKHSTERRRIISSRCQNKRFFFKGVIAIEILLNGKRGWKKEESGDETTHPSVYAETKAQ